MMTRASTDELTGRRARGVPMQEAGLMLVILAMVIGLGIYGYYDAAPQRDNTFLNRDNLIDGIATPMSYYAIMAIGMTAVVIAGGIDISVGSVMALAGLVTASLLQRWSPGAGPMVIGLSLVVSLAVGLACGLVNGALVTSLRMHPFIVTLGTLSIFRCLATAPFSIKTVQGPTPLTELFRVTWLEMRIVPLLIMLAVIALGWVFLRLTIWGRETYAVGGNEEAARFSGISVGSAKLRVYAISGALAGLAGFVSLGRFGTMSSNSASGYELTVVAAAVVGGASLSGGRGSALGALLGTLVLALIENAISILRLQQDWKLGIVGLSIIIAVAFDRLSESWRSWRAGRR